MSSLLFKRKSLCEVRALYRSLFRKREYGRLRPNDSKSRGHDRTLYTFSLIIVRQFRRDKNREITFIKTDTVRFGPRVLD
jgi:hypothetical protein